MIKNRFIKKIELEKFCSLDYFYTEKIPITEEDRDKGQKYIEKYKSIIDLKRIPMKPLSKLLNPNDY